MCDQPIQEIVPSDEVAEITKDEFDFQWNEYINTTLREWNVLKNNLSPGKRNKRQIMLILSTRGSYQY